jgi:uncharacterized protein YndB with AHSA1/START domain
MIRAVLRIGTAVVVAGWVLDRVLRWRAGGGQPSPISTSVVIDAPIERVWAAVADVEGQPRWMRELKSVRLLTPPPIGVGTQGEGAVRILGIAVTDPVVITDFEPPTRFAIRHEGAFSGGGTITLEPGPGTATTLRWDELVIPPVLPHAGSLVQRPILRTIFQGDLDRLRHLVETGAI